MNDFDFFTGTWDVAKVCCVTLFSYGMPQYSTSLGSGGDIHEGVAGYRRGHSFAAVAGGIARETYPGRPIGSTISVRRMAPDWPRPVAGTTSVPDPSRNVFRTNPQSR